jgi:hypothetical protein
MAISWQISTVEVAGFSTWPSLAFSPSGQAAIAYHSSDNQAIMFATLNADGTWAVETVDKSSIDSAPSLRFRFSRPAVSYTYHPSGGPSGVRFALNRGGTPPWSIVTVAQEGRDSSLAIGPSHRPAISFSDKDHALQYRLSESSLSTWVGETVDDGGGSFTSLAFTPSEQPAIAYLGSDSGDTDVIKYAAFDGSQWSTEVVGDGWGWCTLAFTPSGDPAISYMLKRVRESVTSVVYAVPSGAGWTRVEIAADADSPSLAFTPAGEPAISYHDDAAAAVKYAVFSDRTWQHFLVEQAGKDQNGIFHGDFTLTSLAFSPSGQPAVSYYDRSDGTIKCAVGTVSVP